MITLSFAVIRGLNVSTSQFSKPTTARENEYLHDDVADYSKLNQSVDDPNCLALNMNHFARVILKQRGRHCLAKTACHLASTGRRTVIVLAWLQSKLSFWPEFKRGVIKIKFLKLWDLSGYSERTASMIQRTDLPKMSISGQSVFEILAQLSVIML